MGCFYLTVGGGFSSAVILEGCIGCSVKAMHDNNKAFIGHIIVTLMKTDMREDGQTWFLHFEVI